MQVKADGQNYAPKGKSAPVVGAGEFKVGVIGLDHGHIYGMCNGLSEAGADITLVYDPNPEKIETFVKSFPNVVVAKTQEEVLTADVKLIASAAIPSERCDIGIKAMEHGKDFFADKPPITTKEQLKKARETVSTTGRRFFVYFSERLHVEAAVYAGQLIEDGAIGKVISVAGFGPHRLNQPSRPSWFFEPEKYGGILVDIGCHQIEQILYFTGAKTATVSSSRIASYKGIQGLQDYGDATITCDNGAVGYFRVDWFTPNGLGAWGDGRTTIVGTDGYIELRKYLDVANDKEGDHVYMVNHEGEHHFKVAGTCGFPYFGKLIRDSLDKTETAISQEHTFHVMELAITAQENATKL